MNEFLSQNAALLVAVIGLLVTIIVQWEVITKRISNFASTFDRISFIFFELLMISVSGTFVASVFWIMIDFLTVERLSLNDVLLDIASGAAWGIPIALLGAISAKSLDRVIVTSVLAGVIILILFDPNKVIARPELGLAVKQIYAIALFLLVVVMGAVCGYAGFRTKSFINGITAKNEKRNNNRQ